MLEEEAAELEKKRLEVEATAALEKMRLEEEAIAALEKKRLEEEAAAAALEKNRLEEETKNASEVIMQHEMNAATLIQAHLRTFHQRQYFVRNLSTAVRLQSTVIMSYEVSSANAITSRWRAFEASKDFSKILCQVIAAQAISRRHLAQKSLFHHKRAVTKISSTWRRYFAVRTFMESKRAATIISSFIWRLHSLTVYKRLVNSELSKKSQCYSEVITNTHFTLYAGVILCQSIVRRHSATKEASHRRRERYVAAASTIQSKWRAFEASQVLAVLRHESIIFRSTQYRNIHRTAVTKISASWRRYSATKRFQNIRRVILSQSIVRRYIASNEASLRRHESQVAYATSIQSKWRAYEASKQFALSRQRVILIQSITRMQFAMKYLYIHQMFATEISAAWRRSLAVKSFMRSREAATKITSFYRRIKCLVNYRQVMRGVIICQNIARRRKARKEQSAAAAKTIQANWRAFIVSMQFVIMIRGFILLQSNHRRRLAEKQIRLQDEAALKIGQIWRKYSARMLYTSIIQATIGGNSFIISNLCADSATVIGTKWRSVRWQMAYEQLKGDIVVCQSSVRQHIAIRKTGLLRYEQYKKNVEAAIKCQAFTRRCSATKEVETLRKLRRVASATVIQANWRAYEATM
eukprot:scaffold84521_cov70-Cyclotella_meneghiniana.AAC.1